MAADDDSSPPEKGGKTRLVTIDHLDRRTKAAQVALATKDAIAADLGGADQLTTLENIMVENAAMSVAVLRDLQVRWMSGEKIPVTEMATIENTFNRGAMALGLQRRAKDITPAVLRSELSKKDDKDA